MPPARRQVHGHAGGLLFLFLIGTLVLPPSDDPFSGPAEAQGHGPVVTSGDAEEAYRLALDTGLFGRFRADGDRLDGDLLDVTVGPLGLTGLHHKGRPLLDHFEVAFADPVTEVDGPVARLSSADARFEVHDNRYAWLRFDGTTDAAVLRFAPGTELVAVPEGIVARRDETRVHVHYEGEGENNLTMDGSSARIEPRDGILNLTMSLATAIHHRDILHGSWSLVAVAGDSFVADILTPGRAGHRPAAVTSDRLDLEFDPIDPNMTGDAAHRVDSVGVFPTPPHLYVEGPTGNVFRTTNLSDVFTVDRAVALANVSHEDNVTQTTIRQPFGLQGTVSLVHDNVPPQIQEVAFTNVTGRWSPSDRPPYMVVRTSEPVSAELLLGAPTHAHVVRQSLPARDLELGLKDLRPSTRYAWILTVTDRAGNDARTNGTFVTSVDVAVLIPAIEILRPGPGSNLPAGRPVLVEATITDGIGRSLPAAHVSVFLDGENRTHQAHWNASRLLVRLGLLEDGPHTVTLRAQGYSSEEDAVAEVSFNVGTARRAPAMALPTALLVLAAAVAVAGHGREQMHPEGPRPPQT